MADKDPGPPSKRGKTFFEVRESKRQLDRDRGKTKVVIGESFGRWRELKQQKGLKTDALVAKFLLDSYDNITSTPLVKTSWVRPQLRPPVSTITQESLSDRDADFSFQSIKEFSSSSCEEGASVQQAEAGPSGGTKIVEDIDVEEFNSLQNTIVDWEDEQEEEDETWNKEMETQELSTSEEDETKEMDSMSDDSQDQDYVPPICLRAGGALQKHLCLDNIAEVSMEDTILDDPEDCDINEYTTPPVNAMVITEDDVMGQPASVVYHDVFKQLLQYLQLPINLCTAKTDKVPCNAVGPFEVSLKQRCTAVQVEWICPNGHTVWKWSSQRQFKYGMFAGDFMLGVNILLSGNNFRKIALMFKFMNMGIIDPTTFYKIQDGFCVDNIEKFWMNDNKKNIEQLKKKDSIVLLGDARMDSPGFCATYCTYTMMENDSKRIVYTFTRDKRPERNSVTMEKKCFIECVAALSKDLKINEICTDAHAQIAALFNKGDYKDKGIKHSFDIWHGAKNLSKRIVAAGHQKDCAPLLIWNKDITNHFWYCCKTAETYDDFMDLWTGVLHHVTGVHQWYTGSCRHGPLEDDQNKEWIKSDSVAHQRLRELVYNVRWLKTVEKYLAFRSTADLESFHNHILMYASKRFSFTEPVMRARICLATLDYNNHLDRPLQRRRDGSVQTGKIYSKRTKSWRLYSYKIKKEYKYIADLQAIILRSRLLSPRGMAGSRPLRPNDPRNLGSLAGGPTPTLQELEEQQLSRAQLPPPK